MKARINGRPPTWLLCACLAGVPPIGAVQAQDGGFVYQGELFASGQPATGTFDFRVVPFSQADGGFPLAPEEALVAQSVTDGVFLLNPDFDVGIVSGGELFLDISVKESGQLNFTALAPRWQVPATAFSGLAYGLDNDTVTSDAIIDGSVTSIDIADEAFGVQEIALGSVQERHLADGAVGAMQLADAAVGVTDLKIAAVSSSDIAPATVTARELANNAVGTSELSPGAIGTIELGNGAVTATDIAAGAVTATQIAPGQISSDKFANGAVGLQQINANQVQQRITGSCPTGQGIRAVTTSGGVVCEVDNAGLTGFGSPQESLFAFSTGDGSQTRVVGNIANEICQLSYISAREVDNADETVACALFPDASGNWILEAFATPGRDGAATCRATCMTYVGDL
ncbi:MAG: hypothetical protein QNJ40_12125 [Xanthomonadales bacterium]|nr:hypothetical protein [Xanthomonadales bacterium]